MKITIDTIDNKRDYERALDELEKLIDISPKKGSAEFVRFEAIAALVEAYEDEHYPIPEPDPIAAIEFRLDQMGMDQSDLIKIMGTRQRVWEVLKGKRKLTLPMIRRLHKELGIPAESLIGL